MWKRSSEESFVEENHDLVIRFLRVHRLDEAEYYDVVIFAFMEAAKDYLSDPELQKKHDFAAVANRRMWFAYCKEVRHELRPVRYPHPICVESIEEISSNDCERSGRDALELIIARDTLERLLPYITEKEMEVVRLRAQGYLDREIAGKYGISAKGIASRIYRMRRRIRANAVAV